MWRSACAVALLCAALAVTAAERAEMSASPFVLTRYGRASPAHRMAQRDRFHLVGRYGKRSGADERLGRARLALALVGRDRDRRRASAAGERDGARHEWRPRYAPYAAARSYERTPEVVDVSSGEHAYDQ